VKRTNILFSAVAGLCLASAANAAEILVTTNISTSTTWTANNTYNLQQQIYVLPGATLTIEPGTIIASDTNIGGSLAVCRGAQIIADGTQSAPIIFTSKADVATWTSGNPQTGTWRASCNEWGNLTIMGSAYISENIIATNTAAPNAANYAPMEGLVAAFPGDTNVLYGGGNDDDDSGSLRYVSFRYGGKVIGLNNELNGLSLGGIGRATEIDHVEIMNNVDDGIEIWGGTVNLKYFSIWNIGDDSLDIDQGWRGKGQFGLIVQGYSVIAAQGSGIGDNALELDGAEQSDYQPVTTGSLYNLTVIGQPVGGDHGTAWRDNCRMQIRSSIFMDLGEQLVRNDNVDGDGGAGYGFNGTLSWANTWTTAYNVFSTVNAPANPAAFYTAQVDGNLNELRDSVFFRNQNASAYTEATARGVLPANATNLNVQIASILDADAPIRSITRGPAAGSGSTLQLPVIGLDPRANNAATTSSLSAPNDGFFTPVSYRGAFHPTAQSWLCGWTASTAFGFTPNCDVGTPFCFGDGTLATACPCGNNGLVGRGCENSASTGGAVLGASGLVGTDSVVFTSSGELPTALTIFLQGNNSSAAGVVFGDGVRCTAGSLKRLYTKNAVSGVATAPTGANLSVQAQSAALGDTILPGTTRWYQAYYRDANPGFCPNPPGSTFNISSGLVIVW
jgi:hypothetical protein